MNIAELSTAALRCVPTGCRVGTVLAVPNRGDAPGLLAELADRLALDGYEVLVLPGNPQDGAIGLVEEAPRHAEPVVVLGVAAGAVAYLLTTARRGTTPLTAVGNRRRVRSLRWSLAAWLAYRGVFRSQ